VKCPLWVAKAGISPNKAQTLRRGSTHICLIVALYKRANALGLVAGETFAFPLTQQHMADALGLSLVHTNKTLARLRRLGMFKQNNGMLTLTNPRVLERVGQHFDEEIPLRPLI
jgi:CRP-like cAMP-binding protein